MPAKPGAWLMATAKHRAIDAVPPGRTRLERKTAELGREIVEAEEPDWAAALDEVVEDDVLRLVFISCHPVLSREARVALTLRLIGGLTTDEIARAFLVPEPTVAQRIVRAKRTLTAARVPFEVPAGAGVHARLASVLEVIYLIFNEGYAATAGQRLGAPGAVPGGAAAGPHPRRADAGGVGGARPGRADGDPGVAAAGARRRRTGEPVLLPDQDRGRWDRVLIGRGLAALDRAGRCGTALGPYALQAAIGACHARARTVEATDWPQIAALYEALAAAVAVAGRGAQPGRRGRPAPTARRPGSSWSTRWPTSPALRGYHLLPSVRGDLLEQLGRRDEARREFEHAATLTRNEREQALLRDRAAACARALGG